MCPFQYSILVFLLSLSDNSIPEFTVLVFVNQMIANEDYVITTQPAFCTRKFACAPTSCEIGRLYIKITASSFETGSVMKKIILGL